jgi:hypothetical protein
MRDGTLLATLVLAAAVASASPVVAAGPPELARTLAQARVIRAEVDAHSRRMLGRKLGVTEASTAGVVASITLDDWVGQPRVLPAANGLYYAICPVGATCPYPARAAAWRPVAFLPRRLALELALRTFVATSASMVVVALPTARPVWVVFERDDVLADVDAFTVLNQLRRPLAADDGQLRNLVHQVASERDFVPLAIIRVSPEGGETILAVALDNPE